MTINQMEESTTSKGQGPERERNFKWDSKDLDYYVGLNIFEKKIQKDHIALAPFWLSDPLKGAAEDLEDSVGRWKPSVKGYLVAYENIKFSGSRTADTYVDQPWLHVDIQATFYTYTPTAGQTLRGIIKKVGAKAALCTVFNCFVATVFPASLDEMAQWKLGSELEFSVKSAENRRKGPVIIATSRGYQPNALPSFKYAADSGWEDWSAEPTYIQSNYSAKKSTNVGDIEISGDPVIDLIEHTTEISKKKRRHGEEEQIANLVLEDESDYSVPSKKKKRDRVMQEVDPPHEQESIVIEMPGEPNSWQGWDHTTTAKKKKKHKHNRSELVQPEEKSSSKKKHKEILIKQEVDSDEPDVYKSKRKSKTKEGSVTNELLEVPNDEADTTAPKKKKKHKHNREEEKHVVEELEDIEEKSSKKKKKKHKEIQIKQEVVEAEEFYQPDPEALKKKKKSKRKHQDDE